MSMTKHSALRAKIHAVIAKMRDTHREPATPDHHDLHAVYADEIERIVNDARYDPENPTSPHEDQPAPMYSGPMAPTEHRLNPDAVAAAEKRAARKGKRKPKAKAAKKKSTAKRARRHKS